MERRVEWLEGRVVFGFELLLQLTHRPFDAELLNQDVWLRADRIPLRLVDKEREAPA